MWRCLNSSRASAGPRRRLLLFSGVVICPEIPKRGRPRWKVGTKIYKELERGLTAKIRGVTVGPQLCSLLVLAP